MFRLWTPTVQVRVKPQVTWPWVKYTLEFLVLETITGLLALMLSSNPFASLPRIRASPCSLLQLVSTSSSLDFAVHCSLAYPDKLEKLYLRKSEVIPEEKVLAVINEIERGGGRGRRTQERYEEKKATDIAPKNEDQDEELIEAIQLTAEFAEFSKLNQAVVDQLCPAYGCFIPFSICRKGGFTAHGSGPDHIEITGGTYDLFGAFGQIITPTPFNQGTYSPVPYPSLVDTSIEMNIEICYYEKNRFPYIF